MVKGKVRSLTAGVAALAAAGLAAGFALAGGGVANAAGGTAPPWYTQYNSSNAPVGGITFYNAQGQVVTGGSITANGLAAYAVADTADPLAPHTKATLFMYTPVSGENPLTWSGEGISTSDIYPNTSAPAPIGTTTNPVESNNGTDFSVQSYINAIPNTDTSTTDGYGGMYDVRLRVSGGAGTIQTSEFWDAVISVSVTGATSGNPGGTGGTWTLAYPGTTQNTTTTLTATPPSPQNTSTPSPITLTATVGPATDVAGTVSFWTGYGTSSAAQVGTTQTVSSTSATASVSTTPPADATTGYTAVYTPAVPDAAFNDTTSTIPSYDIGSTDSLNYVVSVPQTSTSTTLTGTPASPVAQGSSVTLTATEVATDSTHPAGNVQFFQGKSALGAPQAVNTSGVAVLTTTALAPTAPAGTQVTATFTPTSSSYASSTSNALTYTVDPVASTPTISGKAQVGQTVKCNEPLTSGEIATYSWQAGTTSVGTNQSLTIPASAYNQELSCTVSVSDGGGPAGTATSATVKVALGNAPTPVKHHGPSLSGKAKVGKTLKVNPGKWSPSVVHFTYQWLLNGKVIKHATKSSFKLSKADKGKKISCRVIAHLTGYANGTATTSSEKVSS
jgi:hypothetical protein